MFGFKIFLQDPPIKTKQKTPNKKKQKLEERINATICKLNYIRLRDF